MHGYFLQLKLYDAARMITNPFAYEEHREKLLKDKMAKLADTRIRSAKKGEGVKVNKGLAAKIQQQQEKEARKAEKKKLRETDTENVEGAEMEVDAEGEVAKSLLNDPRFKEMFEDPDFEIDEQSREFSLLNPSTSAAVRNTFCGRHFMLTVVSEEECSQGRC
jgi:ribosome biogenesis protein ENP2